MSTVYKVIEHFTDLQDNDYSYNPGDAYPRNDYSPTDDRIKELASSKNRQGKPLIKRVIKPVSKVNK